MPTPFASGRSDRAGCDSNEADSAEPGRWTCPVCAAVFPSGDGSKVRHYRTHLRTHLAPPCPCGSSRTSRYDGRSCADCEEESA